jgi:Rrf2 family protein
MRTFAGDLWGAESAKRSRITYVCPYSMFISYQTFQPGENGSRPSAAPLFAPTGISPIWANCPQTALSNSHLPKRLGVRDQNSTLDGIDFQQFVTKMVTVIRREGDLQGNSRFAVGVHAMALALIAQEMRKGKPITSGAIAAMVGVHPVHVRRVLGALREAGLVESQPGPTGGWELARDPKEISLYDIYRALEPELPFEMPSRAPEACCRFAPNLPQALAGAMDSAKRALQQHLSSVTLDSILVSLEQCSSPNDAASQFAGQYGPGRPI